MDGTAGAVRIRQADGVVIVQDPLTALHDGMPNAVIQRGIHDHILPVGAIAQQLVACSDPGYVRPALSANWASAISQTLNRILALVRQKAGFDLSGYKPSPLLWRIQQRMDVRRVLSFDEYAFLVEDDPIELDALVRGIPIHVTGFFRDPDAWTVLGKDVLLPLVRSTGGQRPLRAWTPACSTGEEAYSLAMLLNEAVHDGDAQGDFQVCATDAAPEILARASRGLFRDESLAALSATRRARYFYSVDRAYRVKRFLRERMAFAQQDLISDPPFSGLDLVTCRNLLIYLEPEAIRHVLFLLHSSLRMGGYLFLGKSEGYRLGQLGFETVSSQWNIYRKAGSMPGERTTFPAARVTADVSILSPGAHRAALPGCRRLGC
jgi:two-component system, chemotaxis family, CheB/CheR fusion protein